MGMNVCKECDSSPALTAEPAYHTGIVTRVERSIPVDAGTVEALIGRNVVDPMFAEVE